MLKMLNWAKYKADSIWISNHGGRMFNSGISSGEALLSIKQNISKNTHNCRWCKKRFRYNQVSLPRRRFCWYWKTCYLWINSKW